MAYSAARSSLIRGLLLHPGLSLAATCYRTICVLPKTITSVARAATIGGGGLNKPSPPPKDAHSSKLFEFEQVDTNVFRAENLNFSSCQLSPHVAFGGVIMAQALAAAESTVTDAYKPHSMHSSFFHYVDTTVPVDYHVRVRRNGKSLCARSVEATQNGKVVFCLQASFHAVEPSSCMHQPQCPKVDKQPLECPEIAMSLRELLTLISRGKGAEVTNTRQSQMDREQNQFDMRCTDMPSLLRLDAPPSKFYFWMRAKEPLSDADERLHRWMAVVASDCTPAFAIIRPLVRKDLAFSMIFSLDHVIHFHNHEIKADEWLLYELDSTSAGAGRGFSRGRIWGTNGKMLASFSQEMLIRTEKDESKL